MSGIFAENKGFRQIYIPISSKIEAQRSGFDFERRSNAAIRSLFLFIAQRYLFSHDQSPTKRLRSWEEEQRSDTKFPAATAGNCRKR
ncbi:MAG: hypothetical protein J5827_01305, partial [Oscillospiraceae bacterium]|nr:hypothetical protein [Oscillospiraceae bacterium]